MVGVRVVAVAGSLVCLAGCTSASVARSENRPPRFVTTTHVPGPVRTVLHKFRIYRAGDRASFQAQAGVALRLTASRPSISRTSLSHSHGYPPQHGYYLTFHLTIANTGGMPVQVQPTNFAVRIARQGLVTSYDGNSPYSGAPRQLDTTQIEPGERLRAPLTFDVRATHGRLDYRPDGSTAVAWTF